MIIDIFHLRGHIPLCQPCMIRDLSLRHCGRVGINIYRLVCHDLVHSVCTLVKEGTAWTETVHVQIRLRVCDICLWILLVITHLRGYVLHYYYRVFTDLSL